TKDIAIRRKGVFASRVFNRLPALFTVLINKAHQRLGLDAHLNKRCFFTLQRRDQQLQLSPGLPFIDIGRFAVSRSHTDHRLPGGSHAGVDEGGEAGRFQIAALEDSEFQSAGSGGVGNRNREARQTKKRNMYLPGAAFPGEFTHQPVKIACWGAEGQKRQSQTENSDLPHGSLFLLRALLRSGFTELRDAHVTTEFVQLLRIDGPVNVHQRQLLWFSVDDNQPVDLITGFLQIHLRVLAFGGSYTHDSRPARRFELERMAWTSLIEYWPSLSNSK